MTGARMRMLDYVKRWQKSSALPEPLSSRPRKHGYTPQQLRENEMLSEMNTRLLFPHFGVIWVPWKPRNARLTQYALVLSLLMNGCSTPPRVIYETETEVVRVPVTEIVPVPASLTRSHPIPPVWLGMPYSALEAVALECAAELISANADKAAIRSLPHE